MDNFIEFLKNPSKKTLKIIGYVILISFILLATMFIKIIKEENRCQSNPFVYGAWRVGEDNPGLEIFCSCNFNDPNFDNLLFSKEGMTTQSQMDFKEFNILAP